MEEYDEISESESENEEIEVEPEKVKNKKHVIEVKVIDSGSGVYTSLFEALKVF